MKIYLASSWRNTYQATVLAGLRAAGHDVYDFKNPAPGNAGFGWRRVDPGLTENLSAARLRAALAHPVSRQGFKYDFDAMKWADACVLLLPSGMSAHLEAGWFAGARKPVVVMAPEMREPELMYKMFDDSWDVNEGQDRPTPIFDSLTDVLALLAGAEGAIRDFGDLVSSVDRKRPCLCGAAAGARCRTGNGAILDGVVHAVRLSRS